MTRPRRRLLVVSLVLALVAVFAATLPFVACGKEHVHDVARWYCPMHPTYVSDKPGDCPICGMRLVPLEKGAASELADAPSAIAKPASRPGERKVLFYRSPMNPAATSPVPKKDDMGMDYIPVYADEAGAAGVHDGMAPVQAGAAGVRLSGVQTAVATRERLSRSTRTVGLVTADERRVRHVHTKIMGWVEKLYVNYTGQAVRAGQPILSIYSPDLLASQEELLRARESAKRFAGSSLPEVRRGGEDLVTAARRRLELLDVPASFIATVERTGKAQRAVTLTAPASGYVTAKDVVEGQEVQPGMELFTLTDLSSVWVEAELYEYEARSLRVGQRAEIRLPYDPGKSRAAAISFIYPTLSPESRTIKARFELANSGGDLRPGMYVDVLTELNQGEGVSIPDDAVIDSGLRQVVFVEREPGVFEPRTVTVGLRGEGKALIVSGIAEGERVVTHATFLLDSESRLRAAIANAAPPPSAPPPPPPGAGP
jgi:membrane fusion protein, copper/silver efflux system